ncbi:hypothetical protein AB3R30_05965 [Leptolyngbyaceae cyanobacterium UHCC 1019]
MYCLSFLKGVFVSVGDRGFKVTIARFIIFSKSIPVVLLAMVP